MDLGSDIKFARKNMKNIEDIPIALLPDLSDNVPIGVALQSMSKPTKAKRAAQEKVRSYQAASRSKNIDKANRKEEIQEFRRKSYQPKGYNPPVGSVGKKRKSDNLNQKSKGTSFETLRSGSGKSETSDSTKSDMSSDTIYNVTVVDYQKKAKTTIKQVGAFFKSG